MTARRKITAGRLARGDDPEEIMRCIVHYRAGEKHDPEYYARHTVAKAQAALQMRSGIVQSEDISKRARAYVTES